VDNCSKNEELKIWESLKKVKLKDKIKLLPGKINFKLNENGSNLSGGQKQRISIARALYHDRQVLFLDESTSFLDSSNEKLIMKLLKENKNLTKILITHNKDLLKYCNKILFLNKKISKMVIKN
jgi:ABC-type bacteriocin/lantibiotic exporter with double-glycine peptidase domain